MMLHIGLLVGCAAVIYLACEWFVNAVEWLGVRLKVGPVAVGTILAAAGTALPESVVTFVAVLFGDGDDRKDIGVGAAMGGPLALSTIAYGVAGIALLLAVRSATRRGKPFDPLAGVDLSRLARDQRWFLAIFVLKVSLGLVAFAVKPWLGLLFSGAYVVYFLKEMREEHREDVALDLEPLRLQPNRAMPSGWAVFAQTAATLAVIFVASQVFVAQLEWAGPAIGLSSTVVALLLAPVATELPEVMNAIIWIRQRKPELALANISGAMMIQVTVPSALGIGFTSWKFDAPLLLAGLSTIAAITYMSVMMYRRRMNARTLARAVCFYALFAAGPIVVI